MKIITVNKSNIASVTDISFKNEKFSFNNILLLKSPSDIYFNAGNIIVIDKVSSTVEINNKNKK